MSRVALGGVLGIAALIVVACGPAANPGASLLPAEAAPLPTETAAATPLPTESAAAAPAPTPLLSWYRDADGDGHGDRATRRIAIDRPGGYVTRPDDCNDTDPAIYPGAIEIAGDGVDNDCDGQVDEVDVHTPAAPSPAPGL